MNRTRVPYAEALAAWKRSFFLSALDESGGHQGVASEILGVHPNTLNRLLREVGLTRQAIRAERIARGLPIGRRRSKESL